jgi:hypothetical protein
VKTELLTHDLGDGLTVACMSCVEHGMEGWNRFVARERERCARVKRMHREYSRRNRTRARRRASRVL